MWYINTNDSSRLQTLREVVLSGPCDGGLCMPAEIPRMNNKFFTNAKSLSFHEISLEISNAFFGGDIPVNIQRDIIYNSFNFDLPLVQLSNNIHVLELFHGPTHSFKDFGSRFMSGIIKYLIASMDIEELYILVATSGDTGSAIASSFLGLQGVKIIILYPKDRVSKVQEKQLTAFGQNIYPVAIHGTFDDCQKLVKQVFADQKLNQSIHITSANSINIARLIPQSFYYFYVYFRLISGEKNLVISVPSGNFGNLTAGLIAKRMGLPVYKFIAATNANDSIPRYIKSGIYKPRKTIKTISNSMDVGRPSNFERMLSIYDSDYQSITKDICSASYTDEETTEEIQHLHKKYNYICDPHTAIAYSGLINYISGSSTDITGVLLATAHPGKFESLIKELTGHTMMLPEQTLTPSSSQQMVTCIRAKYSELKDFLTGI